MKLYAQHGYQKGDKLDKGLDDGLLDGVVFGPICEKPDNLRYRVAEIAEHGRNPDVLIDPQLYVPLVPNARRQGYLPEYDSYYDPELSVRDLGRPSNTAKIAKTTLDFQLEHPVSRLLSPTIICDSFTDRTAQIAVNLAEATIEYHQKLRTPPPLLISMIFSETALASHAAVEDLLDTVSLYQATGFYITVVRSVQQYQQAFIPAHMAEWLLIIYSLSRVNDYEVVCGYTDLLAYPAAAAGAAACANGWSKTLRMFDISRFQPATGGRAPRARYTSAPLLNSIYVSELEACFDAGRLEQVKTGTDFDKVFKKSVPPENVPWPASLSALHHWATLKQLFSTVRSESADDAIGSVEQRIGAAQLLYADLRRRGVQFETTTGGAHLVQWAEALELLRSKARL